MKPGKRDVYLKTTPLNEALSRWLGRAAELGALNPLGPETLEVADALGRVTAEPVSAKLSYPFYHASAMDGYAVRFPETFGASETSPVRLRLGEQAREIDTGDAMPGGFNAVVMVEDTNVVGGHIEIIAPLTPWQNVRTVGEDIVATELIVPENHRIRPIDIGALLAGGHTDVPVRRRPRVAIIPTGTEVVEPGGKHSPGDIIEFNSRVLGGRAVELGAEAVRHPIVPDDPDKIMAALEGALKDADIVVINAGASAGTEDYTAQVMAELGEVLVHGVDIRPGKPVVLGFARGVPVVGTPGYPVAAYLCFELFVKPLIMNLQGLPDEDPPEVLASLSRHVASGLGQEEFIRVKLGKVGEKLIATPLARGAGLVLSLSRADGVLRVPPNSEGIAAGSDVTVSLMRDTREIENTLVFIGSHDNTIDLLASTLRRKHPKYWLSSAHVGSMGGLTALLRGEAHAAPTHLLDEATGEYNVAFVEKLLPGRDITLINLVHREQGLIVPKGNPKGIKGLGDLTREDVAFINRQRGSGTRLLLDKSLRELGIGPDEVRGYGHEEYTHMAVASAVLSGMADTGLGVLSAANALGLDFIAVTSERYDIAVPGEFLEFPMMRALLGIIETDAGFRKAVLSLGGYDVSSMGSVVYRTGS